MTTCKGRLHHLRQTLPLMMAQSADEVVVVDYGCPDSSGDWTEQHFPQAKVVRVTDDPGFSVARARNLGAAAVDSGWLVFIDADIEADRSWIGRLRPTLQTGRFYRLSMETQKDKPDTCGTAICAKADFDRIGGYDEVFRGWGGEDLDLYLRLESAQVEVEYLDSDFLRAIPHGDEERDDLAGGKAQRMILTACYSEAKAQFRRAFGQVRDLPLEVRGDLMGYTRDKLDRWFAEGATRPIELRYVLDRAAGWVPQPYAMRRELALSIQLAARDAPVPSQDTV